MRKRQSIYTQTDFFFPEFHKVLPILSFLHTHKTTLQKVKIRFHLVTLMYRLTVLKQDSTSGRSNNVLYSHKEWGGKWRRTVNKTASPIGKSSIKISSNEDKFPKIKIFFVYLLSHQQTRTYSYTLIHTNTHLYTHSAPVRDRRSSGAKLHPNLLTLFTSARTMDRFFLLL